MNSSDRSQPQEQVLLEDLDPRRVPPQDMRHVFKRHSRAIVSPEDLSQISDSSCLGEPDWVLRKCISEDLMEALFQEFQVGDSAEGIPLSDKIINRMHSASIYESTIIPGRVLLSVKITFMTDLFLYLLLLP